MASRVQLETLADFTGGLNLRRDAFQLAANESPDLLNVDVDPRGGFKLRGGLAPWGEDIESEVTALVPFKTTTGAYEVLAQADGKVYSSTGGAWTDLGIELDGTVRSTVFKDRIYLVSGPSDPVVRYDGSAAVTLDDPNYNDDLSTPTTSGDGHMPLAKCITTHMGSVFVANIVEDGTGYPNRIRWSHPNFPEDWRSLDFIDIDIGHDGDEITALVPYGDRLLVFKRHSIHAIYGEPPTNLQVFPVTVEVGAASQEAAVSTDIGVYFYSVPEGVFLYQGKDPQWQFERLVPATLDGNITAPNAQNVQLGWGNRRLWLSVPWQGDPARDRVFVLDPSLGKAGSWVAYDLSLGPFLEWSPPGGATDFLAAAVGRTLVVKLDVLLQPYDSYGEMEEEGPGYLTAYTAEYPNEDSDPIVHHIDSYLMTRWVDLGVPAIKKRWKRPQVVMLAGQDAVTEVEAYSDYDKTKIRRRFNLVNNADETTAKWGEFKWGQGKWARGGVGRNQVERGTPLGNGKSIALKFKGPQTNHAWGVDAVSFTYIPRKLR